MGGSRRVFHEMWALRGWKGRIWWRLLGKGGVDARRVGVGDEK